MPLLYEKQVKSNIQPQQPNMGVINHLGQQRQQSLETLASVSEGYKKEVEIYEQETLNLGQNVVNSAQKIFPDDPVQFEEAVQEGLSKVESNLTDEQKVRLRSYLQLQLEPTRQQVQVKAQIKQDNQNKDSIRGLASSMYESVIQNIGNDSQDMTANIGQLVGYADSKDSRGNYILSASGRARIEDLAKNSNYYRSAGMVKEMIALNDKKGLGELRQELIDYKDKYLKVMDFDKYTDLLDSTKGGYIGDPVDNSQTKIELGTRKKELSLGLKDGKYVVKNDDYGISDVYQLILDTEQAYEEGRIKRADYESDIIQYKAAYFNMAKEGEQVYTKEKGIFWTSKPTVGSIMIEAVDLFGGDDVVSDSQRFDVLRLYDQAIKAQGVDPKSTDTMKKTEAMEIINKVRGNLLNKMGHSKDEVDTPQKQEVVIEINKMESIKKRIAGEANILSDYAN